MTAQPRYSRAYHPALAEKMEGLVNVNPRTGCWEWTRKVNADGYGHGLYHEGQQVRAHRVAFLVSMGDLPPQHLPIRHLCDNPACCRPDHLAVGTTLENAEDRQRAGRGGKNSKPLVQRKRDALAARLAKGTDAETARELALSISTVNRVRRGRSWGKLVGPPKGTRAKKLDAEKVRAIRASNEPSRVLAERYGVTAPNIDAIRNGRTWRHVT
ncbi:MAG: HNH endonuclease signature motif containing protein [Erythrobacter sp.]|uniref:HNH endonuclease signature motif containing protein n=1 Tax=Erythrobacter sp. TaxID=1042 RepID=UPI003A8A1B77